MYILLGIIAGLFVGNFFGKRNLRNKLFDFLVDEYQPIKKFCESVEKNTEFIENDDESDDAQKKKLDIITSTSENLGKSEIIKRVLEVIQ